MQHWLRAQEERAPLPGARRAKWNWSTRTGEPSGSRRWSRRCWTNSMRRTRPFASTSSPTPKMRSLPIACSPTFKAEPRPTCSRVAVRIFPSGHSAATPWTCVHSWRRILTAKPFPIGIRCSIVPSSRVTGCSTACRNIMARWPCITTRTTSTNSEWNTPTRRGPTTTIAWRWSG